MYIQIRKCRICGNSDLEPVLDLGEQMLTGVFPRKKNTEIAKGPLRLVKCTGDEKVCGLVQLQHTYDLRELYGKNYGYRSGLNADMVSHLNKKVRRIEKLVTLGRGDLVVDVGSNDGTTLRAYPEYLDLVGIDPTGAKFRDYYPSHVQLIVDFFSARTFQAHLPGRKAKIVTSFSMFYDLESPMDFMKDVHDILADDGVWVFEQSYLPSLLETNSYDTVCHEHLEYYSLRQIKWMAERVGFAIIDVEFNDVNGGSFSITVAKTSRRAEVTAEIQKILDVERDLGLEKLKTYEDFAARIDNSRRELINFISRAKRDGKTVAALGASTKGNVLLQYCKLTERELPFVGEVNVEKYGCYTPGTWIPIVSQEELLTKAIDYLIVLPWHFRKFFANSTVLRGRTLVFPLPSVTIVKL